MANEAVRRMSGSLREREAQPSSEIVNHIVKAEVSVLDTKVDALAKAELDTDTNIDALDTKVDALQAEINGKMDALQAEVNFLSWRQARHDNHLVDFLFR